VSEQRPEEEDEGLPPESPKSDPVPDTEQPAEPEEEE
jgi:hypothetical protein